MSATPSDTTTNRQSHEFAAVPDSIRNWYYLEYEGRVEGLIRGPFTLEDMRVLFNKGTIDDETPVRYFYSQWHRLKDVPAILTPPPQEMMRKRAPSERWRVHEVAVFGVLVIILELILVHWK